MPGEETQETGRTYVQLFRGFLELSQYPMIRGTTTFQITELKDPYTDGAPVTFNNQRFDLSFRILQRGGNSPHSLEVLCELKNRNENTAGDLFVEFLKFLCRVVEAAVSAQPQAARNHMFLFVTSAFNQKLFKEASSTESLIEYLLALKGASEEAVTSEAEAELKRTIRDLDAPKLCQISALVAVLFVPIHFLERILP